MINIQFWRRVGLILFIVGATSFASTKPPEDTQWLSALLYVIGAILFLMPDDIKKEF
jgi:hypothetical protein